MCAICQVEIEALAKRRKMEIDTFIKVKSLYSARVYQYALCWILNAFLLSVAEQRVPGWGGSNSDPMYQHAVVQRVGELCEGQRQRYDPAVQQIQQQIYVVRLSVFTKYLLEFVFSEPPGPIDNSKIGVMKGGHIQLKQGKHQHCLRRT